VAVKGRDSRGARPLFSSRPVEAQRTVARRRRVCAPMFPARHYVAARAAFPPDSVGAGSSCATFIPTRRRVVVRKSSCRSLEGGWACAPMFSANHKSVAGRARGRACAARPPDVLLLLGPPGRVRDAKRTRMCLTPAWSGRDETLGPSGRVRDAKRTRRCLTPAWSPRDASAAACAAEQRGGARCRDGGGRPSGAAPHP
jgi:hypothetical protein